MFPYLSVSTPGYGGLCLLFTTEVKLCDILHSVCAVNVTDTVKARQGIRCRKAVAGTRARVV